MSTSEQPNIICVKHEHGDQYEESTNQSPIYLENQPTIPVSQKTYVDETYDAFHISEKFVVIQCNGTNTLVNIEYPWQSKPLHVHIIEHVIHVCDDWCDDDWEVCRHTIFVFFNDHILRICLTNTSNVSSFTECKTDFSFRISKIESSSFTILEDERNERLRACLVSDETSWKKVELVEIYLFCDDERLFTIMKPISFKLPRDIDFDCVDFDYYNNDIVNMCLIEKTNDTFFSIFIHYGKTVFDYDAIPIFLLQNYEGKCILAINDQVDRLQTIEFEIIATMYVCPFGEIGDLKPEINDCIDNMLKVLNKYYGCQYDLDLGPD